MKKNLVLVSLFVLVIACNKDKFQTKPQISLKSITEYVPKQGQLLAVIHYTDKEGDIQDTLFAIQQRINIRGRATGLLASYPIPKNMPDNSQGDINLTLNWGQHLTSFTDIPVPGAGQNAKEPDSLIFRFVLKDKANNVSDTLVSPLVIVER